MSSKEGIPGVDVCRLYHCVCGGGRGRLLIWLPFSLFHPPLFLSCTYYSIPSPCYRHPPPPSSSNSHAHDSCCPSSPPQSKENSPRAKGFFVVIESFYLCGGSHTHLSHGPSGVISSPLHTQDYPANAACTWMFTVGRQASLSYRMSLSSRPKQLL